MRYLFLLFLIPSLCFAQPISAPLNITEEDASPTTYPYKLKFSNGTVTDNGDGTTSVAVPDFSMTAPSDQLLISQTSVTGTEWTSGAYTGLMVIDDNRTGATVSEKEEATLILDSADTSGFSFYATGKGYFGGPLFIDGSAYFSLGGNAIFYFASGDGGAIKYYTDDGIHWAAGNSENYGNRNIIICDYTAIGDNYGHGTLSANPAFIIHSVTRAATATNQFIQSYHDTINGVIDVGTGVVSIPDGINVTGGTVAGTPIQFTFTFDGGGSEIADNANVWVRVPQNCTLTGWDLTGDTSGAIKVDVWNDTYANFPPADADTITGGHEPEIAASGVKAQDLDIADWGDVTIVAGTYLKASIDSCTTTTHAVLTLYGVRS